MNHEKLKKKTDLFRPGGNSLENVDEISGEKTTSVSKGG